MSGTVLESEVGVFVELLHFFLHLVVVLSVGHENVKALRHQKDLMLFKSKSDEKAQAE